jgi:septal ring factor EnvC (AmiA/AmiB activator)
MTFENLEKFVAVRMAGSVARSQKMDADIARIQKECEEFDAKFERIQKEIAAGNTRRPVSRNTSNNMFREQQRLFAEQAEHARMMHMLHNS